MYVTRCESMSEMTVFFFTVNGQIVHLLLFVSIAVSGQPLHPALVRSAVRKHRAQLSSDEMGHCGSGEEPNQALLDLPALGSAHRDPHVSTPFIHIESGRFPFESCFPICHTVDG